MAIKVHISVQMGWFWRSHASQTAPPVHLASQTPEPTFHNFTRW